MNAAIQTVKDAASYVSESVQQTGAEASKEANKNVAKDSNAPIGTRANAAVDALSDKKDESSHSAKAEVNEQKLKN